MIFYNEKIIHSIYFYFYFNVIELVLIYVDGFILINFGIEAQIICKYDFLQYPELTLFLFKSVTMLNALD